MLHHYPINDRKQSIADAIARVKAKLKGLIPVEYRNQALQAA
ncbi:hypothetical protein [Gilliamella apicola]|nr:hypothetical protein [Gilliamella apicola]